MTLTIGSKVRAAGHNGIGVDWPNGDSPIALGRSMWGGLR